MGVVFLMMMVWFVRMVVTKEVYIRHTLLDVPVLLFGAVIIVSSVFSLSPTTSILGRVDEYVFHAVQILLCMCWFWLMIQHITGTLLWRWAIQLVLLSGALPSLLFLGKSLPFIRSITDVVGVSVVTSVSSTFGIYIAGVTVIALGLLSIKGTSMKTSILPAITAVLGLITLIHIGFTLPFIVFFVGIIGLLVLVMTVLADIRVSMFLSLFGIFVVTLLFILLGVPQGWKDALPVEVALGAPVSWSIVSQSFLENTKTFLLGNGPGTFIYSFSAYRPAEFNINELIWSIRFRQPYSTFFSLFAELGILGVLSWLFVSVFTIGSIVHAWFQTRPSVWKRVARVAQQAVSSDETMAQRLRLELFVVVAGWMAITAGFFITYYDFMMWWLWWTLLALVFIGLSALIPSLMRGKRLFLQVSPQYTLAVSFGLLSVVSLIVFLGALYTRLYIAEIAYTKATRVNAVEDISVLLQQTVSLRSQYVPYQLAVARLSLQKAKDASLTIPVNPEEVASYVAEAVNQARLAASYDEHNVETWETLSSMYLSARVFTEDANTWAQDALLRVIELEPTNAIAHWRLADTYVFVKDFDKAKTHLKQSIALKPNYIPSYIGLADVYELQSDLTQAIAVYQPIFDSIQSNSPEALYRLGRLFFNRNEEGDMVLAKQVWLRAVELSPQYADALFSLGLIAEREQNFSEAREYYTKVQTLNPENPAIQERLNIIP